jgi:hypothetical protein
VLGTGQAEHHPHTGRGEIKMTNAELLKAIVEIHKLIHPDTTPPAEEVSDGGILDMIFQIVEPIVEEEIKMTDAEKLIQQFKEERDAHVREDIETDNPYILSDLSQSQVVQPVAQIQ